MELMAQGSTELQFGPAPAPARLFFFILIIKRYKVNPLFPRYPFKINISGQYVDRNEK